MNLLNPPASVIYQILKKLGSSANPDLIIRKIRQHELGLPAEDEFMMILSWLGKCQLVHKIDQLQLPPSSVSSYKIPDLFAVFNYSDKQIKTLIEVKATETHRLVWRDDYFKSKQKYADLLGIPLLIAWKLKKMDVWFLFDSRLLSKKMKNYKIDFELAAKNNLMGILAGDFIVILRKGVGLNFKFRKIRKEKTEQTSDGQTETWLMRIEDAFFTNGEGQKMTTFGAGLWALFIASPIEEKQSFSDDYVNQSWVLRQDDSMQWAHKILSIMFEFRQRPEKQIDWQAIIRDYKIPIEFQKVRQAANEGIKLKVVQLILDQQPQIIPDFLK